MSTLTHRISYLRQMIRFLHLVRLFLWTLWIIYREYQRMTRADAQSQRASEALIRVLTSFRNAAVKQSVLPIKLGQFLSTRIDVLPEQAIAILSSLQDEVPPVSFSHVVAVIESELGKPIGEVFSTLEHTCSASASLGQVHKAVLVASGETVAVKIQRPQIEQQIHRDLSALRFSIWIITRFLDTNPVMDLMGIYREFARTIYEEIDYVREAANAKRFHEIFKDDPTVAIPRVYDQYVSRRVLVLEWIDGIKINAYAALDAAGINHFEVARRTVYAYFFQFFEAGFFHADPHPGNILIKQGSPDVGPIVALVDFGMVGVYTKQMRHSMRKAFLALVARDARAFVNALAQLGFMSEETNRASLEQALSLMIERYSGITLGEVNPQVIAEIGEDVKALLYGQALRIPAQFAFIGRAISTLMGVTMGLAPEFNLIEVATPYARKFLGFDARGAQETLQQLFIQLLATGRALLTLPQSVEQVLMKLETGQIVVTPASNESRGWDGVRGRRRGGNSEASFTQSFMFVMSLAGGIFLIAEAHQLIAAWFCFGLAGAITSRTLVKKGLF